MPINQKKLESIGRQLLETIGEDPERTEIKDTPKRFARWWIEFMEYQPGSVDTMFQSATLDQMVVVSGMRVWSLCEHHLLPFYCDIAVGYITNSHVLGLSKFARIAHKHAHSLQVQERLVVQIADEICQLVGNNVAVIATGEHLCMTMRGVKTPGKMTSSVMRGVFRDKPEARQEFLSIVYQK